MVFAMHQIQVASIVRHLDSPSWFEDYLSELSAGQRLIASVTSEIGTGGDMGRSIAPVTPSADGRLTFTKLAPTVSYGAYADDLLTTVRRSEMAESSDQVLVLSRGDQTDLEQTGTWDTIGMRGTCSPGFTVRAQFAPEQILAAPFSDVMNQTHVPISHILWSHVWLGIATDAFERGRSFVRGQARRSPGAPTAGRLGALAGDEPPGDAARRGLLGAGRVRARQRAARPRPPGHDGLDPALQQPQARRLRADAGDLHGGARARRDRRLQERLAVRRRAVTCETRCPRV